MAGAIRAGANAVMGGSNHPNHTVLARKLQDYLRWRNAKARRPGRSAARICPHPQRTLRPPKAQTASRMTNEHTHAVSLSTV